MNCSLIGTGHFRVSLLQILPQPLLKFCFFCLELTLNLLENILRDVKADSRRTPFATSRAIHGKQFSRQFTAPPGDEAISRGHKHESRRWNAWRENNLFSVSISVGPAALHLRALIVTLSIFAIGVEAPFLNVYAVPLRYRTRPNAAFGDQNETIGFRNDYILGWPSSVICCLILLRTIPSVLDRIYNHGKRTLCWPERVCIGIWNDGASDAPMRDILNICIDLVSAKARSTTMTSQCSKENQKGADMFCPGVSPQVDIVNLTFCRLKENSCFKVTHVYCDDWATTGFRREARLSRPKKIVHEGRPLHQMETHS